MTIINPKALLFLFATSSLIAQGSSKKTKGSKSIPPEKVVDIDPSTVADMAVRVGMDTSDMTICGDSEVPRQAISEFCGCEEVRGELKVRCDCDWPFDIDIVLDEQQDAAQGVLFLDNESDKNEETLDGMVFNSILCNEMFNVGVDDTGLDREGQLRGTGIGDVSPAPRLASKSSKQTKSGGSF